uniref:Uncharacterized protein n=1 Tax=Rhodnius prolixus TaxID=13249 RepID=T1I7N1_RHOPR
MKAKPREHPLEFLNRLDEKRNVILTRYRLDGISGIVLNELTRQLDAHLVRIFLYGIHPSLGAHLQSLQCQALDDTRLKLINDCGIILSQLKLPNTPENNTDTITNNHHNNHRQKKPWRQPHTYSKNNYTSQPFHRYNHYYPPNLNHHSPQIPQITHPNYNQLTYPQIQFNRPNPSNFPSKPFNPHSQNTVSMKTVRPRHELTITEMNQKNEVSELKKQIETLNKSVSQLTEHFLELGTHHHPPDP